MQPRSRTRCRDPPPPPPGGGRHRRRSPPPPSPRHQRRPPPPQRRSPDRPPPRRYEYEEIPIPVPDPGAEDRRKRADILLEAGRLAAHYLVAQGVIPDHLLRAREDPNHARPEPPAPPPPAPASYGGRKRDDDDEEDPRWRRGGEWGRAKGRSGWDRRSHSFDDRRKHDVGARRARSDYDEPKRPPMSRSYSHNDRRPSGDGRLDPRRRSRSRSRSRSRTRTRSYHYGGGTRRDSDGRRDLDHAKLPDSAINPAHDVEMPRKPKVPSSVVVAEQNDSAQTPAAIQDAEMVGLDHDQDVSEEEDGEFAEDVSEEEDGEFAEAVSEEEEDGEFAEDVTEEEEDGEFAGAGFNVDDGAEMDATEHRQLSDMDVHLPESVEEPAHMQSQLSNVEEPMHMQSQLSNVEEPLHMQSQLSSNVEDTAHMQSQLSNVEEEMGAAPMDTSMAEPSADKDGSSEVRDEMEPPQSEVEAGVSNIDRDEQELPAWYRIFDLNVVETQEGCEIPDISGDSPAHHVCDSVPDLAGQMNEQTKCGNSEIQDQDEHAGANHPLEYRHGLSKYDLNNMIDEHAQDDTSNIQGQVEDAGDYHLLEDEHDLNKCDLNHEADAHAQDNHLLRNEEIHLNHGMAENDSDNCRLSNEQMLLKQNVDEKDHDNHQMENERVLVGQGTSEQGLDSYHVSDKKFTLSHATDEQVVNKHQSEPGLMHIPMCVHDVDSYNLNSEETLLNTGRSKHAEEDTCHLKDGGKNLDQAVDAQARVHNMGNVGTVHVIDLEDAYEQQPGTRYTGEFLESISYQDTSSFPDNPHTNIQAVSSSSNAPNFGNRCIGRGAANSQVIPGDDDVLYCAFDKMPLEVINVWDLPSSELGKSS